MNWQVKCEKMFGYHWKRCIADLTGVHKRSVSRWVSGEFQIPEHVKEKIGATYKIWKDDE